MRSKRHLLILLSIMVGLTTLPMTACVTVHDHPDHDHPVVEHDDHHDVHVDKDVTVEHEHDHDDHD